MVKHIACGDSHSHILSESGHLYSMGSNKDGRLGIGLNFNDLQHSVSPRLIETLTEVV